MANHPLTLLLVAFSDDDCARIQTALARQEGPPPRLERLARLLPATPLATAPSLILLNLAAPEQGRLDRLRQAQTALPAVPIVVAIADQEGELGPMAIQEGAQEYLRRQELGSTLLPHLLRHALERHQQQELTRLQEQKYRLLFESAPNLILVVDEQGTIIESNRRCLEVLACQPAALIGQPLASCVVPADRPQALALLAETLAEKIIQGQPFTLLRQDQGEIAVTITGAPLPAASQRQAIWFIHDNPEKRVMTADLAAAQKMEAISTLTGGFAHDFNNILTGIIGNLDLGLDLTASHGLTACTRPLETARLSAFKAGALVKKLVTFSRGGFPNKVQTNLAEFLAPFHRQPGPAIDLQWELPPELWPVRIDRDQMAIVIHNLLANCVDAMPAGGKIWLSARNHTPRPNNLLRLPPGEFVQLDIKDEGQGIASKDLDRIFEPYFTTKPMGTQKGMGLGLAIVHSIITKHDGHIRVQSTPAASTTISLYLPALADRQARENPAPGGKHPVGSRKILVLDDEEIILQMLSELLFFLGYEAAFARDGEAALQLFLAARDQNAPFDMAILDLVIPDGMGGEATNAKLLELDPELKTIVSSGYADAPIMANFRQYGFRAAIAKPYCLQELQQVLAI